MTDIHFITEKLYPIDKYFTSSKYGNFGMFPIDEETGLIRRRKTDDLDRYIDLRIAMLGSVDSGKSSTIGVLTSGAKLDDGRGKSRQHSFNFKHERKSGRTSSVSRHLLCYNENNELINREYFAKRDKLVSLKDWPNMIENTTKVTTLIDLCGHEKYLKTTIRGVMSSTVDFASVVIAANDGLLKMTREHLTLLLSLQIPFFIILTKKDICPEHIYKQNVEEIKYLLKRATLRNRKTLDKITKIENMKKYLKTPELFSRMVMFFEISNVTGENIDLLINCLGILPKRLKVKKERINSKNVFARVQETFYVEGRGTVVLVYMKTGTVNENDTLYIGPYKTIVDYKANSYYKQTKIRGIHKNRVSQSCALGHETVTFLLKNIPKYEVRKGMVLVNNPFKNLPVRKFKAEILILKHSTTVKKGYAPVIVIGNVRQSAKIVDIEEKEYLRTRDKGIVTFKFCHFPEFIHINNRLIVSEGNMRAVGKVIEKLF